MSDPRGSGVLEQGDGPGWVPLSEEQEAGIKRWVSEVDEAEQEETLEDLRRCREAREAWNCRLHMAWDPTTGQFYDAVQVLLEEGDVDEEDLPAHYTDPFYLAYGLDVVAVLATVPFKTKFWPGNPDDPKDQTAATRATDLVAWFRKQNDDARLRFLQAYYLYTDGRFLNLTSYRPDAQKFGTRREPIYVPKEIELMPASGRCFRCGTSVQEGQQAPISSPACPSCGDPEGLEMGWACEGCGAAFHGSCPGCGAPMSEESWRPAVRGEMPVPMGEVKIPGAGPVYEVYGALEARWPAAADRVEDCGWIDVQVEVERAQAIAAFKDKEDAIRRSSYPAATVLQEARYVREAVSASPYGLTERERRVTYRRRWIRPEMFYDMPDGELRRWLIETFEEGALFVFVNDVLVRARPENLLDRCQIATAYPGLGSARPAIGTPVLHLQYPHDELFNLRMDGLRQALPAIIANPNVVNIDAMNAGRTRPGMWYPSEPVHGESLSQAMSPTPTPNLPNDLYRLQELLPGQRAQHASGIVPALWGGQMGGAGETASGYAMMREQALQRMRIPLGSMKLANEGSDLQAIRLFQRWHEDDVAVPQEGPGGTVKTDTVTVDELEGEIQIRSDQDIPIPATQAEKVERFFRAVKEDGLRDLLLHPENEGFIQSSLGDDSLKLPGQANREQQRLEIDRLLRGEMVEVNVLLDDHQGHMDAILAWWPSPDAEKERTAGNPFLGAVIEHFAAHAQGQGVKAAMLAAAAGQGMPGAMPPPGPPPPGGAPMGPPA